MTMTIKWMNESTMNVYDKTRLLYQHQRRKIMNFYLTPYVCYISMYILRHSWHESNTETSC